MVSSRHGIHGTRRARLTSPLKLLSLLEPQDRHVQQQSHVFETSFSEDDINILVVLKGVWWNHLFKILASRGATSFILMAFIGSNQSLVIQDVWSTHTYVYTYTYNLYNIYLYIYLYVRITVHLCICNNYIYIHMHLYTYKYTQYILFIVILYHYVHVICLF